MNGSPEWLEKLQESVRATRWHATSTRWQVARETAAIEYLQATLGTDRFLPPIGGWSVDYSVVAVILDEVRRRSGPFTMLELGGGSGTPWFATIAERNNGHLITVEHNPEFIERVTSLLDHYDVASACTLALAELTEDDGENPWYHNVAIGAALGDREVDVLIVDGPPGTGGQQPRRPALFALQHVLVDGAMVVLDDVVREEEQQTLAAWEEAFGDRIRHLPILDRAAVFVLAADGGGQVSDESEIHLKRGRP